MLRPVVPKQYVQRLFIHGRRRDIGLGSVELVSLEEARIKAFENRRIARIEKGDPTGGPTGGPAGGGRPNSKAPTFRQASKQVHKENLPHWRNDKHGKNWLATLENYAFPRLGSKQVDRITTRDILGCLRPIWSTKQETARRVRSRIHSVMSWSLSNGFIRSNPAGEVLDAGLPKQRTGKSHFRALPYEEVASALATVEASSSSSSARLCLRLLVLTAARSGEARGARWSEVDERARLWVVPASRMKGAQEHRVPLSDEALAVLLKAKALEDGSGLVFPSQRGRELSDMTLTKMLRSAGLAERATIHGMRTSFKMWADELTDCDHSVKELSLSHTVGTAVQQAYSRSDLLEKRRSLLEQWSGYLTSAA